MTAASNPSNQSRRQEGGGGEGALHPHHAHSCCFTGAESNAAGARRADVAMQR